jgi:hypothetical protein
MKSIATLIRLPLKLQRKVKADAKRQDVSPQSVMIAALSQHYAIAAELPIRGGQRKAKK